MKLWLLKAREQTNAWKPWYDKAFGFVVRAETEDQARAFAQKEGGDEVRDYRAGKEVPAWTDPNLSTCEELIAAGEPGVVLRDFAAA